MRRPARIDETLTRRLIKECLPLLTPAARALADRCEIYVVNSRRGKASSKAARVTVPSFVFREQVNFCQKGYIAGGVPLATYYLAHELAHIMATKQNHGPVFMEAFKKLCPDHLQHYEYIYKPRPAKAAGLKTMTEHEHSTA